MPAKRGYAALAIPMGEAQYQERQRKPVGQSAVTNVTNGAHGQQQRPGRRPEQFRGQVLVLALERDRGPLGQPERRGEIVGLTGLVGSGAKELLRSLFGLAPPDSGEVRLDAPLPDCAGVGAVKDGFVVTSGQGRCRYYDCRQDELLAKPLELPAGLWDNHLHLMA